MVVVVSQAQRGPGLIDSGEQNIATVLGQPASLSGASTFNSWDSL